MLKYRQSLKALGLYYTHISSLLSRMIRTIVWHAPRVVDRISYASTVVKLLVLRVSSILTTSEVPKLWV